MSLQQCSEHHKPDELSLELILDTSPFQISCRGHARWGVEISEMQWTLGFTVALQFCAFLLVQVAANRWVSHISKMGFDLSKSGDPIAFRGWFRC